MSFKMPDTSKTLSLLYTDTVNVSRITDTKDENNITRQEYLPVDTLQGISCKLSMAVLEEAQDKEQGDRPMLSSVKLFYMKAHNLLAGDKVEVFRDDVLAYTGYLGKPSIYHSHVEVDLSEELYN